MTDFNARFDRSIKIMREQVFPIIIDKFLPQVATEIYQNEGNMGVLERLLDCKSGIDALQICQDGIRGIACRVQNGNHLSFTVRRSKSTGNATEYDRLRSSVTSDSGWLYPVLFVQAYTGNSGQVESIGVVRTVDLIDYIEKGFAKVNATTDATFFVCYWYAMKSAGYRVGIYEQKPVLSKQIDRTATVTCGEQLTFLFEHHGI